VKFLYPTCTGIHCPAEGSPRWNFVKMFDVDKTRMIGLPYGEKTMTICKVVLIEYQNVRQVDGQTDRTAIPISHVTSVCWRAIKIYYLHLQPVSICSVSAEWKTNPKSKMIQCYICRLLSLHFPNKSVQLQPNTLLCTPKDKSASFYFRGTMVKLLFRVRPMTAGCHRMLRTPENPRIFTATRRHKTYNTEVLSFS